jgi:hypothetical protein
MQLNELVGAAVLTAVIAVPVGAVLSVYRENLLPYAERVKDALAFDPRHPGITYDRRP